jgi:hypothetical protein
MQRLFLLPVLILIRLVPVFFPLLFLLLLLLVLRVTHDCSAGTRKRSPASKELLPGKSGLRRDAHCGILAEFELLRHAVHFDRPPREKFYRLKACSRALILGSGFQ